MKLPFGKYKNEDIKNVAFINPSYILWLNTLPNLKDNLKNEINYLVDDCKKRVKELRIQRYNSQLKDEYDNSIQYDKDIKFWSKVSPLATYDHIKKYNIDVSDEDWKEVCNNVKERE